MKERARILLAIIREANTQNILIPQKLTSIIKEHLGITWEESLEIGEILKADAREQFANHPDFGTFNEALNIFPKPDQS